MPSLGKTPSLGKLPSFGKSLLSRRATLATLASAPAIISSAPGVFAQTPAAPALAPAPACILTPAAVPGPFYFDPKLHRADITEGHPGVPLRLRFIVLDAANCALVSGARVDVWQTRADGYYSGYPGQGDKHNVDTSGGTFMRGTQIADARGEALFHTVYPGWYDGRTVHVHFKIFIDDKNMLTGQMYFPDALSQYVFANVGAYRRKAVRNVFTPMTNSRCRMERTAATATPRKRAIIIVRRWWSVSAAPSSRRSTALRSRRSNPALSCRASPPRNRRTADLPR